MTHKHLGNPSNSHSHAALARSATCKGPNYFITSLSLSRCKTNAYKDVANHVSQRLFFSSLCFSLH